MIGLVILAISLATIVTLPLWARPAWRRSVDRESELPHERVRRERADRLKERRNSP